mgnify:CR=1 FL=1
MEISKAEVNNNTIFPYKAGQGLIEQWNKPHIFIEDRQRIMESMNSY